MDLVCITSNSFSNTKKRSANWEVLINAAFGKLVLSISNEILQTFIYSFFRLSAY